MPSSVQNQTAVSGPVPPPTPQEITRKLSVHNKPAKIQPLNVVTPSAMSGTESDSDPFFSPDHSPLASSHSTGSQPLAIVHPHSQAQNHSHSMSVGLSTSVSSKPLSSIAERRSGSGDEESDDNEEGDDDWLQGQGPSQAAQSQRQDGDSVIKTGYLYKKGERRKTWKRRWFVLRPAHLAFYKNSAEYQLLRLVELSDVHSCSAVELKRHANSFVLVSPSRTYYLQAGSDQDMQDWVRHVNKAREALLGTSTQNSAATPIAIPASTGESHQQTILSHSPSNRGGGTVTPSPPSARSVGFVGPPATSDSDSEDQFAGDNAKPTSSVSASPSKAQTTSTANKDPSKIILSGYLMKSRSKRRGWRKRWFVLTSEMLYYSASHMDTKRRRSIELSQVIDALEYDLSKDKIHSGTSAISPPAVSVSEESHGLELDSGNTGLGGAQYTFKIVTTKRPLLLCAPSEAEEIKWLSAVRALIARRSNPLSSTSPSGTQGVTGNAEGLPSPLGGVKSSMSVGGRKRSASGASALTHARDEHSSH